MVKVMTISVICFGTIIGFIIMGVLNSTAGVMQALQGDKPVVVVSDSERQAVQDEVDAWLSEVPDTTEIQNGLASTKVDYKFLVGQSKQPNFTNTPEWQAFQKSLSGQHLFNYSREFSINNRDDFLSDLDLRANLIVQHLTIPAGLVMSLKYVAGVPYSESIPVLKPIVNYKQFNIRVNINNPEFGSLGGDPQHLGDSQVYYEIPYKVIDTVTTYNGVYKLNYDTKDVTETQKVPFVMKGGHVEYYPRTLTTTYPHFTDYDYTEDYTPFNKLVSKRGFRSPEEQLVIFRQALAYQPSFTDPKLNTALANDILSQLGIAGSTFNLGDIGTQFDLNGVSNGKVPAQYYPLYVAAGKKFNIPWNIIAAIHFRETTFGTNLAHQDNAGNPVDGHYQTTQDERNKVKAAGGNDGFNPDNFMDVKDATYTEAHLLRIYLTEAHGVVTSGKAKPYSAQGMLERINYNSWYAPEILKIAKGFISGSNNNNMPAIAGPASQVVQKVLKTAFSYVGGDNYALSRGRNQSDIQRGIFDCSSFVRYVFWKNGVDLGPMTSVTTWTLETKGQPISEAEAKPGDLVFFPEHVGICIGGGKFVGYQTSGCYVADIHGAYWGKVKPVTGFRRVIN